MRKKLLIYSNLYPSDAFPLRAMFNKQQFERLAEVFDVEVVVPVGWLEWFRSGYRHRQSVSRVKAWYFPYFYTPGFARGAYAVFMWLSLLIFRRRVLASKPDAVMASWAFPDAVAMSRLLRNSDLPFFVKVHGTDVNLHCQYPWRRKQVVAAMSRAGAVVSVSQDLKDKLVSYGVPEDKVRVVYNGVDPERFYPASQARARDRLEVARDARLVLFVGNLLFEKGALDLLEAFGTLAARGDPRDFALVYVGEGAHRRMLESAAKHLVAESGRPDVRFVGRKPHDELKHWMDAADVVCLPSHSEGVPNVLLEAMSCGKPVVASKVGGIPEIVSEETGILVDARDVAGLARALSASLEVRWDRERIVAHSRRFSWERNIAEVAVVVNDTCLAVCDGQIRTLT